MLFFSGQIRSQTRTVGQAEKKKQNIEQRQRKAYEKARKKSIKDKFDMQTEETQKRMKASRKRARKNNPANRKTIGDSLFKKKKKPKNK
ncbi:MAG: hypothetical protein JW723_03005 [Bacteroidales bacterium]|nr:hypothetical protein [Bacteroidales bacterium]